MENWDKIKESILFEYQGDWKQIVIENYALHQHNELVSFIDQTYGINPAEIPAQADSFQIDKITLHIYQNEDWQFDFNPKQTSNTADLNNVIEFMTRLSLRFQERVFLTHEAINDYPLITVGEDMLSFNYEFWNKYKEL
ncbi:hypothetical protein [Pontibacter rugosus]|uniref:Uncharacterized protein n=1 Tax=Pontibacter rugosus TaxID=1745966 RepID=A0ABW3SJI4_9BACT